MRIVIPWRLILVFFSLATFYYFNQKRKTRNDERRERLNETRQAYLDALLKKKKSSGPVKDKQDPPSSS